MENRENRKHSKHNRRLLIILAVILLLALTTGGLVARFMTQNKREAQMVADEFYISSDYLKETAGDPIKISDWGDNQIKFQIYNYRQENLALIATEDITYEIIVDNDAWSENVTADGGRVDPTDGKYTLLGDGKTPKTHVVTLSYDKSKLAEDGTSENVNVKVKTKTPYVKELSGEFELIGMTKPSYKIVDKGTYHLVTIESNDYFDEISVRWDPEKFSPDNTNLIMGTWKDTYKDGEVDFRTESFDAEPYHVYELIFVENVEVAGTTITRTGAVVSGLE